jgi:hypothetical protein
MAFAAKYRAEAGWEESVVDAIATAPGVQATCQAKAAAIAGSAGRILTTAAPTFDPSTRMLREDVAAGIHVKPVRSFTREKKFLGTTIPVALAVVDSWAARWFEYGHGVRIPMTRFLRNAVDANDSAGWTYWTARDGSE